MKVRNRRFGEGTGAPVSHGLWSPVLFALVAATGCQGEQGARPGAATTRDSAGVRIVENTGPGVWSAGSAWVVVDPPLVDIGGGADGPQYELSRAVGAVRLRDGRVAIANVATSEIRFYDARGRFESASGRGGAGPGEYQLLAGLWRGPDDSLLVSDLRAQRLTVLDPNGAVGRVYSLGGRSGLTMGEGGGVSFAMPQGWLADRSVIGVEMPINVTQQREGPYRDLVTVLRFDPAGLLADTIGRYPGIEMEQVTLTFGGQSFPAPNPVPLGRNTLVAVGADRVFVAQNLAWEVEVRDPAGRLVALFRAAVAPVRLTERDIATHRQEQLEMMEGLPELRGVPPQIRDQMTARVRTASYPETLPFIAGLIAAESGDLWVQEHLRPGQQEARFAVLDSTGTLLGRITMPPRFQLLSVRGAEVVGVWRDPDEVEHVRVYPLRRPE